MSNFNVVDGLWKWALLGSQERKDLIQYLSEHVDCYEVGIYTSNGSGIGTNVIVECLKHGRKSQRDITDYDSW